jgi:alpha-amylase/alpha-mannosidase (GH57 family)
VNDSAMNELSAGRIKISNIFDWYGVDFKQSGTVIDWLNQYSDVTINADAKIGYKNYNWDLNIR